MTTQHFILYTSKPAEARVATREEISQIFEELIAQDTLEVLAEEGQADDLSLLAEVASDEDKVFNVYDRDNASRIVHPQAQHLARRLGWV
jgi:rubrerythrin